MFLFTERLKILRKNTKTSQKKLATIMEVSETQFQNYEYGKHLPTVDKLFRLCNFFEISADYLLGLSDDPKQH